MTYDNQYIEDAKYPNGHYLNEITVTPNGNSIGSISSDAMRDEMQYQQKVSNIKQDRYNRDMIKHIHNGTESAAKFLAPIIASPALPHAWSIFNSSAVQFPLTLSGVKSSINDIKKGDISLSTGLGLLPLAKNAKYINGRTLFNNLPYKALNKANDLSDIAINVLRKPINSNPFKNIFPYQNKRYLASNRSLKGITSEQTYQTTTNNPIGLLKSRIQSKLNNFYLPDNGLDGIPIRNHTGLIQSYKDLRSLGLSRTRSLLSSPFYYTGINIQPGSAVNLKNPFITINQKAMQSHGVFDKENVIAHELSHILDGKLTFEDAKLGAYKAFNLRPLPKRIGEYFTQKNYTELTARGTQLKNYFGISDDTPLTGDMLKYAASNYVKDTGMNNNMNQMFRSIKDWDKAADWFNKHSYRDGGKIIRHT